MSELEIKIPVKFTLAEKNQSLEPFQSHQDHASTFQPQCNKINNVAFGYISDSNQPGLPSSLVFVSELVGLP